MSDRAQLDDNAEISDQASVLSIDEARQNARALVQATLNEDATACALRDNLRKAQSDQRRALQKAKNLEKWARNLQEQAVELQKQAADMVLQAKEVADEAQESRERAKQFAADERELEQAVVKAEERWRAAEVAQRARKDTHAYLNAGIPAAELPGDILRYIMALARERSAMHKPGILFALAASQVCRVWRSIALDTGALWAWIPAERSALKTLESVNIFLDRSRSYPLDVSFDRVDDSIFSALLTHIGRIRNLRISSHQEEELKRLLRMCNAPAPCLDRLHIQLFSQEPWQDLSIAVFPDSPRLISLTIDGISIDCCQLPFNTVQGFSYTLPEAYTDDDVAQIVSRCINFPSIIYALLRNRDGIVSQLAVKRNADSLSVNMANDSVSVGINAMIPPAFQLPISSLKLVGFRPDTLLPMPADRARNLAQLEALKLACGIEQLSHMPDHADPAGCASFLHSFRGLRRLAIVDQCMSHEVLAALIHPYDNPRTYAAPVLPFLHTLAVAPCDGGHAAPMFACIPGGHGGEESVAWHARTCSYGALVCQVVEARRLAGVPLSVLIVDAAYLDAPIIHHVEWLRENVRLEVA